MLGIAEGSSLLAKITAFAKNERGHDIVKSEIKSPKWMDLFKTEGRSDLFKVQMVFFTVLAAIFVTNKIFGSLRFPELPEGLLALIGISNGVYLGAKATSKTVFEKLEEKYNELQKAKKEQVKCTERVNNAEEFKNNAERIKNVAEKDLEKAKDDAQKKKTLEELVAQAKKQFEEAVQNKSNADAAKKTADDKVTKIQGEFDKLLEEASR